MPSSTTAACASWGAEAAGEGIENTEDHDLVFGLLARWKVPAPAGFRKLISGRKLWNFRRDDLEVWKAAL